ncbi:YwqJ-related putative deaminase [Streptomyces luomodiensis]|uniref:YwqJ-related putative deaminase n=1 Tax=Streptomyces luomodiensis TaxID=3026192 RepID=A0ABY9UVA6_9ACTN|nr:YwqJ-related putative deaminase [Streptomyces sp. SCA4-21]WNE96492.1 YwqJ-related putative deaminase [Streptomyces sp. SCA4-21]
MGVVLPDELAFVLDLIGVSWPNVDEDDYRDMADALRTFADDVDTGRGDTNTALNRLISTNRGEMADAIDAHMRKLNAEHLHNLAEAGRLLAGGLDGAAILVEGAKGAAIVQLGILAAEVAAAQAAAPFTLGLSELGAVAGVATTRTIVKRLLREAAEYAAEELLAVATGPVFAALGAMTTDLIVQVAADGAGIQDGIDLGQTAQAGKDGMQLASAGGGGLVLAGVGGGGAGGGVGDLVFDDHEHGLFASRVYDHSKHLDEKGSAHLRRGRTALGRTKGRGSLAQAIEGVVEEAMTSLGDAHGKLRTHLNKVGDGLVKAGEGQKTQNQKTRDSFQKERGSHSGEPPANGGGGGGQPPGGGGNGSGGGQNWHGRTARQTRHHRLDTRDVRHLSPEAQRRELEAESQRLANEAQKKRPDSEKGVAPIGKSRVNSGCAGSLLHNGEITAHTSMQRMKISKNLTGDARDQAVAAQTPDLHPAVRDLYQQIADSGERTGRGHGQCAEVALISDRLHQMDPTGQSIRTVEDARNALSGAVIDTRSIGEQVDPDTGDVIPHGDFLPACHSCRHALPALGITTTH